MKCQLIALILPALSACVTSGGTGHADIDLVGMNSFALAARYGTPASYQHLGEYLQLNYGSAAVGCQVIVLVDQAQRVAGWAAAGKSCPAR